MKIKLSVLLLAFVLSACSNNQQNNHFVVKSGENETSYLKDINGCPKVHIRREDASLIQKEGHKPAFEIVASGYAGHCYFNEKINKDKAVIIPKFKIIRLTDTDVTDIHFSYYLETVEGPKHYLGKKTHFAEVSIPQGTKEIEYIAPKSELIIPPSGTYDLDVYMGLYEDISDLQYKK